MIEAGRDRGRAGVDRHAPRVPVQVTGDVKMDGREPLRQATKLWQEEIDPEFGRPYNDIHLMERERLDEALPWLQKAKQVRRLRAAGSSPSMNLGRI